MKIGSVYMRVRNLIFSIFVVFILLFASTIEAASPSSFSLVRDTEHIINYSGDIVTVSDPSSQTAVHYFPLKYSANGNYLVFCSGDRSANTEDSIYTKSSFTNDYDGAVVAAIIKNGVGENATISGVSDSNIFFTQLAIWKSIPNTGATFPNTESALSESQRTLLNNLVSAGNTAKTAYNQIKNFNITLSSTSLTFTLDGNIYKSQVINVTGDQLGSTTATVNKGVVEKSGNSYVVKVPKNDLLNGNNTITLTVSAQSNSIPIASNYSNGNSAQQTTTITNFDYFSKSTNKSVSGVINITSSVRISKQDATTGKELPGATLELLKPDGSTITWISGPTPKVFDNLAAGKYTLTETIAPEGYIKSTETVTFTVKSDGTVDTPVIMKNKPNDIVVNPKTGSKVMYALLIAFLAFAVSFYFYADYRVKSKV